MPQPTTVRRRSITACLLIVALAFPQLLTSSASGTGVGDKRAQARRISARLRTLQTRVEILAEQYDDAQLRLNRVRGKVTAAQRAAGRTDSEIARRRRQLARYAVSAYTGQGAVSFDVIMQGNGSEVGVREGYASAAIGDRVDLIDSLRAAKADRAARLADLHKAEIEARDARAVMASRRKAASAAVAETKVIYGRVQGELKRLVAAEEARIAAAQQARARAAARKFAARAPAPTAPAPTPATTTTTTGAPTPAPTPPPAPAPVAPPAPAPVAPPAPAAQPAQAPVGQGAGAAIAAARSVLGVRYTWAGASPATGFDCSGLVMWAWAQGGKSLPHSSSAMYAAARKIPVSALQPGDLVFYGSPIHHVALYIGNGQIIHAPHTGSYVQVASIDYWKDLAGAGRV